jgi:predicted aspartyl protease
MELNAYLHDRLICTSLSICFKGSTKVIDNVAIDTGAVESILSTNAVKDIGLRAESTDKTAVTRGAGGSKMRYFYKIVDEIEIANKRFTNIKIDFGNIDPSGVINGLIGLDLLNQLHAVIDIDIPVVYLKD